eukprot:49791_1
MPETGQGVSGQDVDDIGGGTVVGHVPDTRDHINEELIVADTHLGEGHQDRGDRNGRTIQLDGQQAVSDQGEELLVLHLADSKGSGDVRQGQGARGGDDVEGSLLELVEPLAVGPIDAGETQENGTNLVTGQGGLRGGGSQGDLSQSVVEGLIEDVKPREGSQNLQAVRPVHT